MEKEAEGKRVIDIIYAGVRVLNRGKRVYCYFELNDLSKQHLFLKKMLPCVVIGTIGTCMPIGENQYSNFQISDNKLHHRHSANAYLSEWSVMDKAANLKLQKINDNKKPKDEFFTEKVKGLQKELRMVDRSDRNLLMRYIWDELSKTL